MSAKSDNPKKIKKSSQKKGSCEPITITSNNIEPKRSRSKKITDCQTTEIKKPSKRIPKSIIDPVVEPIKPKSKSKPTVDPVIKPIKTKSKSKPTIDSIVEPVETKSKSKPTVDPVVEPTKSKPSVDPVVESIKTKSKSKPTDDTTKESNEMPTSEPVMPDQKLIQTKPAVQTMRSMIETIRRQKHLEYLEKTWLQTGFIDKYKNTLDTKEKKLRRDVARLLKQHYFPEVCNLTKEELDYIPGCFRKRVMLNNSNLKKPVVTYKSDKEPNIDALMAFSINRSGVDDDYQKAVEESLMMSTLEESYVDFDNVDENIDLELEQALILSMNTVSETSPVAACIDLRVYGPNPQQPIFVGQIEYYLNSEQINEVINSWAKIDESGSQGFRHNQMMEYYKSMAVDLEILKEFI
jgi:hypothetical protein